MRRLTYNLGCLLLVSFSRLVKKGTCHAQPFAALPSTPLRDGEQSRTVEGKLRKTRRGGLFLIDSKQKQFPLPHAGSG